MPPAVGIMRETTGTTTISIMASIASHATYRWERVTLSTGAETMKVADLCYPVEAGHRMGDTAQRYCRCPNLTGARYSRRLHDSLQTIRISI
jgi:hypothetical protein